MDGTTTGRTRGGARVILLALAVLAGGCRRRVNQPDPIAEAQRREVVRAAHAAARRACENQLVTAQTALQMAEVEGLTLANQLNATRELLLVARTQPQPDESIVRADIAQEQALQARIEDNRAQTNTLGARMAAKRAECLALPED